MIAKERLLEEIVIPKWKVWRIIAQNLATRINTRSVQYGLATEIASMPSFL